MHTSSNPRYLLDLEKAVQWTPTVGGEGKNAAEDYLYISSGPEVEVLPIKGAWGHQACQLEADHRSIHRTGRGIGVVRGGLQRDR